MSKGVNKKTIKNIRYKIKELDSEILLYNNPVLGDFDKKELILEKQELEHDLLNLLDQRENSISRRVIWNIIVPIFVSVVTSVIILKINI